mmetsp:Transcript_91451/g.217934  ORF Transcript_91451/g.217934 Transcript_91451/m.217934 type:complete len:280 (+) Transcript_91451:1913-2752(+)
MAQKAAAHPAHHLRSILPLVLGVDLLAMDLREAFFGLLLQAPRRVEARQHGDLREEHVRALALESLHLQALQADAEHEAGPQRRLEVLVVFHEDLLRDQRRLALNDGSPMNAEVQLRLGLVLTLVAWPRGIQHAAGVQLLLLVKKVHGPCAEELHDAHTQFPRHEILMAGSAYLLFAEQLQQPIIVDTKVQVLQAQRVNNKVEDVVLFPDRCQITIACGGPHHSVSRTAQIHRDVRIVGAIAGEEALELPLGAHQPLGHTYDSDPQAATRPRHHEVHRQ